MITIYESQDHSDNIICATMKLIIGLSLTLLVSSIFQGTGADKSNHRPFEIQEKDPSDRPVTLTANHFASRGNVRRIELSNHRITRIDRGAFNGLPELNGVDLSTNDFTLSPGIFHNLARLQSIVLRAALSDRQEELQGGTFVNLPRLMALDLSDNKLRSIPRGVFEGLTRLEELNLRNNKIRTISPRAFGSLKLHLLILEENQIQVIRTDTFNGLNVDSLVLANNEIGKLEERAFNRATIGILDLSNNKLTEIRSKDFAGLTQTMVSLRLSSNRIAKIAPGAFNVGILVADRVFYDGNPIDSSN